MSETISIIIEAASDIDTVSFSTDELIEISIDEAESIDVDILNEGLQGPTGAQGAQGIQGPQGLPGDTGGTYVHQQMIASASWAIPHNLNYYPNVTIVDSAGEKVVGDIVYNSINQLTITFSGGFAGKAYLS